MLPDQTTALRHCIRRYQPTLPELGPHADAAQRALEHSDLPALIAIYHAIYPLLEQELWSGNAFHRTLESYQSLFREQEALIQQAGDDHRYHFILSIPVADRPQHVKRCLDSIYQLCLSYAYGGCSNGNFSHVQVIIAEDSQQPEHIEQHIALAKEYCDKGLRVHHFGFDEQYELLQRIPDGQRQKLGSLLTTQPKHRFYRKGQAANRNLSYLKCLQLTEDRDKTLYYMVDSDQAFLVNRETDSGTEAVSALNYFYYINHIFTNTGTTMLTGKLVGDPPVSPSVMAVNFMDDVIAYLKQLAGMDPQQDCQFHKVSDTPTHDAAYHDMALLFGFEQQAQPCPYHCSLTGRHNNFACLQAFAEKLNAFFYGEHLTRKTRFHYRTGFTELSAARTIYPGNYIVNYDGLKYIIPFGDLRLRMSGPTAGRLVQAEIRERFVSTNLPMLHTRHLHGDAPAQFRPGVEPGDETINLADEFERQFFGDMMLFSVARLTGKDNPSLAFTPESVTRAIEETEHELLAMYEEKHLEMQDRNTQLKHLITGPQRWWHNESQAAAALSSIQRFVHNIDVNFGEDSTAYQQIQDQQHRSQRRKQISRALLAYRQSRDAWDELFSDT